MSIIARWSGLWNPGVSADSLEDSLKTSVRCAVSLVALVLALGVAGQLAAAARLDGLVNDAYPALRDARDLASTLDAVRVEVAATEHDRTHSSRVDSLAARFHAIARHAPDAPHASGTARLDDAFTDYITVARAPDAGSLDAIVAEDPRDGRAYADLSAAVATRVRSAEDDVDAALVSARRIQWMVLVAMIVGGAVALGLLMLLGILATRSLARWSDALAQRVDALAIGDAVVIPIDAARGQGTRIDAAFRRLARQLRDNADAAQALAEGAFHRAAGVSARRDPVGVALATLARTMHDLAGSATRVARGDLSAGVEPRSARDSFGQAHAAMTRRLTTTLRDADVMRHSIEGMVTAMRGDAAALASSANLDADRLRRTEERLTCVTLQARADAARSAALAGRASDGDTMLEQGSLALQSSLDGVGEVLRRSAGVQRLARSAGLLAVRAASRHAAVEGAAAVDDEARTLAADAAAAARAVTRIMIEGSERTHTAGVAFDRVALAAREGSALVRELGAASHRQAKSLGEIDDTVSHVQRTTARSADTARQLLQRLDLLASHARRLDVVLRRIDRGRAAVIAAVPSASGVVRATTATARAADANAPTMALAM